MSTRAARITAAVLPFLEILAFAFAAYTFTAALSVQYLLSPSDTTAALHGRRTGAAAVILLLFWILFLLAFGALVRNLVALVVQPPYVHRRRPRPGDVDVEANRGRPVMSEKLEKPGSGLFENFWTDQTRVAFACHADGLPLRCSKCNDWKPNRAHHCSDVGRCVERMDHFCPWFGGIIGSTNTKFFIQFCAFTAVWCLFGVIVLAIFINEQRTDGNTNTPVYVVCCVCLGLMAFFFNFTASMTYVTLGHVFKNVTQIEAISQNPWTLAVSLDEIEKRRPSTSSSHTNYPLIYYLHDRQVYVPASSVSSPRDPAVVGAPGFAIITALPDENPFDLGSPRENFKSVMGIHFWDWILPIRGSPAKLFDSFGPLIDVLAARHTATAAQ